MTDQDQPSPLPWSPETNLTDFPGMIVDANGQPVCDVFETADRNYIMRAVNSHAKLVEALEEVLMNGLIACPVFEMAEAALALAKERK